MNNLGQGPVLNIACNFSFKHRKLLFGCLVFWIPTQKILKPLKVQTQVANAVYVIQSFQRLNYICFKHWEVHKWLSKFTSTKSNMAGSFSYLPAAISFWIVYI